MTTGTNLQLTYDENTDSWSYQNVDYEYPASSTNSWSGYTTPDPEFEYAPSEDQEQEQDNDTVCPPGYIYDTTLLQCVPDPNYQAPMYAGEPGIEGERDYARDAQESFIEFDASTPEGRKSMYEHGLEHGYFGYDTSKGGAYEFQGPKKTGMTLFGLQGLAQFGEDRQYDRYINELAREDAKRKAAGQTPILAQAVGFFGLAESFKNWGRYAMDVVSNIQDTTTGFQRTTPVSSKTFEDQEAELEQERKQEIHEEKLKQERIETEKKLREDLGKDTSSQVPIYVDTAQDAAAAEPTGDEWQPDYSGAVADQQQQAAEAGQTHKQFMSDLDAVQ
jgi:hypothetical protein